jgi:hypothetical protein
MNYSLPGRAPLQREGAAVEGGEGEERCFHPPCKHRVDGPVPITVATVDLGLGRIIVF